MLFGVKHFISRIDLHVVLVFTCSEHEPIWKNASKPTKKNELIKEMSWKKRKKKLNALHPIAYDPVWTDSLTHSMVNADSRSDLSYHMNLFGMSNILETCCVFYVIIRVLRIWYFVCLRRITRLTSEIRDAPNQANNIADDNSSLHQNILTRNQQKCT